MEDDNDFDQFYTRKKPPYSPDLHLKTAIRIYERETFIKGFSKQDIPIHFPIRKSILAYCKFPNKPTGLLRQDSEHSYKLLMNPCLSQTGKGYKYTRGLEENLALAKVFVQESIDILFETLPTLNQIKDEMKRSYSKVKLNQELREWLVFRNIWEAIRDIMKDSQVKEEYTFREVAKDLLKVRMFANPYFLIIQENQETCWLLDYNQVLMISDTVGSRFLSLLYCHIQETLNFLPNPKMSDMLRFYLVGDLLFPVHGNLAYDHIKQIESLSVANYLARYEPLSISKKYIDQLRQEAAATPQILESLERIYSTIDSIATHPLILFELFGCFRHFGHPTVDEVEGVKSLRENSRSVIEMDPAQLKKVLGAFNRMIILEFIAQRRRWPKCTLNEDCESIAMRRLVNTKPIAISEYDLVIDLKDWSYIEFGHEFQFDDFPDFTSLLADTAISPYLQNWYTIFSRDLLNVTIPETIEESRRVLIEVLRREKIDCKEIRETIQSGNIPESWFVVGLHSKERELKIKARLFAMLCLEIRLYFNMTEKNIAEKIFPLIPYQTMTWTDAELNKVMLNLSSLHAGRDKGAAGNYVYVIISLDFNKFNQKWRYSSTEGVFKNIDRLFGTPGLLDFSHKFFQQAFFYLSSNLRPPWTLTRDNGRKDYPLTDIPHLVFESETTWLGQEGGCEGLRQKGWTAIIVSALVANSFDTGVEGQIIGQGDNQVIVASFKIPDEGMDSDEYIRDHEQELTKRVQAYMENLKKITNGIGMDLKLQESWVSTKLLNYGKEIIVDGSYTSGGIKKISRAYQDVSEIFPSFPNRVSSMFTAAQSAAMKSFDTFCPYLIAVFDCLNMISKEGKYGTTMEGRLKSLLAEEKVVLDEHLKMVCLILPRECGGLPVIPHLNLHFRGHPDQMSSVLLWIKKLSKNLPVTKRLRFREVISELC
ncbi:MAG: RNA-dependent RNA polymerase [Hangzhou lispivirus 1]|uniref:RNA-directed RNA polymerase n=1 Tax=Hangzhou lispivirus 1 TaxID=2905568 RepID=A0A8K1XH57_9MONO|nr:MAG: RNA-dependent RNA polymerase [Hangzhou lispivirus 1]